MSSGSSGPELLNDYQTMNIEVFDLFNTDPEQVREFLLSMAKEGLVAGVYLWINRENGKMYVGSSISMYKRMSRYMKGTNIHGIIGNALRKYGLKGFVLVLLLVSDPCLVLALEQTVLDSGTCAYNISPTAGSCAGVKHTEEFKAKISERNRKRKGEKRSEEVKARMRGEGNGKYNKGKPVYLYIVHADALELKATFPNMMRCSETLGVPVTTIYNRIKNRTLFQINGVSHIVSREANLS